MKIAIICAMPEEISLIQEHMNISKLTNISQREFFQGKFMGMETVLVLSRIGKVAASTTTALLLNNFAVDLVIMTGVAGGANSECQVGDVIIGDHFIQHDLDASPIFPKHEIPLLNVTSLSASQKYLPLLNSACAEFVNLKLSELISKDDLQQFNIHNPKVKIGSIASGDQFIKSSQHLTEINNSVQALLPSKLLCVEMEGAAVAQVCYEFNKPFLVIRCISDNADQTAPLDFTCFIQDVACKYSYGIIQCLLGKLYAQIKEQSKNSAEITIQ